MVEEGSEDQSLVAKIKMGDRLYELRQRRCEECQKVHYSVLRFCGASFAYYKLGEDFSEADFEAFVRSVDDQLLQTSADFLEQFLHEIHAINSPEGIDADFSHEFRLVEYARHRLSALQKLGVLKSLEERSEPKNTLARVARLSFELGAAVAEHKVMTVYEDYLWAGIAMEDWRESGLPKAREERLRQGKRTRAAVLKAAEALYEKNPELLRNDTETAREIQKLDLPDLQHSNGRRIGIDAITKHLRASRQRPADCGKS